MSWQVANGNIPQSVEAWLLGQGGFTVERWDGHWELCCDAPWTTTHGAGYCWGFAWPHDRPPTLQEAIEAVARVSQ
jgi:hypothetical protein